MLDHDCTEHLQKFPRLTAHSWRCQSYRMYYGYKMYMSKVRIYLHIHRFMAKKSEQFTSVTTLNYVWSAVAFDTAAHAIQLLCVMKSLENTTLAKKYNYRTHREMTLLFL